MSNPKNDPRAPFPVRAPGSVMLIAAAVALVGAVFASGLTVKPDPSHLLPPGAASVHDLEDVQRRAQAFGTLLVGVDADNPAAREAAARQLIPRLQAIDSGLVAEVVADDGILRRHLWSNRY